MKIFETKFEIWTTAPHSRPLFIVKKINIFLRLKIYHCWLGRSNSRDAKLSGFLKYESLLAKDMAQAIDIILDYKRIHQKPNVNKWIKLCDHSSL